MKLRRSIKNIIMAVISQLVTVALAIVVPRLVLTGYGSEVNGLLTTVSNIYAYLALIETGIGTVAMQALYGPVVNDNKTVINQIMAATRRYYRRFTRYYFIGMIVATIVFPWIYKSAITKWTIMGVMFFQGMASVLDYWFRASYGALLGAEGKNYITNRIGIVITILTNVVKIVLVSRTVNLVVLQMSYFAISMLSIAIHIIYFKINYKWLDYDAEPAMGALKQRNSMIIHQITNLVTNNTDTILISAVCGLKYASVYAIYNLIFGQMSSMFSIIFNSVNFILGQTYNEDKHRYVKLHDTYKTCYCAIVFAIYSIGYILIKPFLTLYTAGVTDIQYVDNWLPLLFALNNLLWNCRQTENNLIYVAGHIKNTVPQQIAEAVINFGSTLILIHFFGIHGALLGTAVAFVYRTNDVIRYVNHHILERSAFRSYATVSTNFALFSLVVFIEKALSGFLLAHITNYYMFIGWAIVVAIPVCIVFILCNYATNRTARVMLKEAITNFTQKRKRINNA